MKNIVKVVVEFSLFSIYVNERLVVDSSLEISKLSAGRSRNKSGMNNKMDISTMRKRCFSIWS